MIYRSWKRLAAGAAVTALAACASVEAPEAPDAPEVAGFAPPPVGTEIDWRFVYAEGGSDEVTSRVVAIGEDFTLYQADTSYAPTDSFDFFVEFAGVFFVSCDNEMPTASERQAALDLWPLTAGGSMSVGGEFGGDVSIGKAATVLTGKTVTDVVWSEFSYTEAGQTYTDRAAVSPELGTVVEMRWDDGALDLVRDIRLGEAERDQPGLAKSFKATLGNCASLLES